VIHLVQRLTIQAVGAPNPDFGFMQGRFGRLLERGDQCLKFGERWSELRASSRARARRIAARNRSKSKGLVR
jgi:hypothetical protein